MTGGEPPYLLRVGPHTSIGIERVRSVEVMDTRRGLLIGSVLTIGATLAGCTGAPTELETSAPPASAPTSTATPTPDAESDEALLPMPVDEIADWAETAVTESDTGPGAGTFSGWMGEHSSPHHLTDFRSLEPGSFQAQIACRGEGAITLGAGDLDEEPTTDAIVCKNATIGFDVTTTDTGMSVVLDLEGDPTVYAVSLVRVSE